MLFSPAYSWLYPEHRDITLRALRGLSPAQRQTIDRLWALVRTGHESRLSPYAADTTLGLNPPVLDYASWPAIAGDHSCSPQNLTDIVFTSDWIMRVAAITAELKAKLAQAPKNSEKDNAMREADLRLLRADPEYVSRAGGNNVHFKLALPDIHTRAAEYMEYCRKAGTPLNATGVYTWFHASALELAARLADSSLSAEDQRGLALAMLADEAFALHFLEDCFASGHVAGIWGDASQRKGTHDYYNEHGYQVTTWEGEAMVLTGDAYMREEDEARCALTVRASLEQVLAVFLKKNEKKLLVQEVRPSRPDTFSVCRNATMPLRSFSEEEVGLCRLILMATPTPGLASGLGAMPRISSEVGPFIGLVTAFRGELLTSGLSSYQKTAGFVAGLEAALRVGIGLEGVLEESSDGLMFIDIGWRLDGPSSMKAENDPTLKKMGNFASAVPSRDAYFLRVRMPYYLIPGDLVILAPLFAIVSPNTMNKVVATAGSGGLIPWQSKMITSIGSFQFVLGREVGVSFFGLGGGPDAFLMAYNDQRDGVITGLRSTQLNFPILEYRLSRSYASRQSADFFLQLHGGIDFPGKRTNLYLEDSPYPPVQNTYFIGLRLVFDYRHYFK